MSDGVTSSHENGASFAAEAIAHVDTKERNDRTTSPRTLESEISSGINLSALQGIEGYKWICNQPKLKWGRIFKLQLWGTLFVVCLCLGLPALLLNTLTEPSHRFFISNDPTISYPGPYDDTVPMWVFLVIYIGIVAAIAVNELTYFRSVHVNSTWAIWTIVFFTVDLVMAQVVTLSITTFVKYIVGRLRPDFLARCILPANTPVEGLYNSDLCTNPDKSVVDEGRKSYPSGHTSLAFCQGVYLSLYFLWCFYSRLRSKYMINKELNMSRYKREFYEGLRCALIAIGPLGAWLIGASRIYDYKHNPSDVNAGAALGALISLVTIVRGTSIYKRWTQQWVSNRPQKYEDCVRLTTESEDNFDK
eukprot:CFRG1338T1